MAISKSPRYVQALFKRTEQYTDRVRQHFATAIDELIKISTKNGKWSPEGFAYSQNKKLSAESTKILRQLYSAVYNEIKQGVQAEWSLANIASDELVKSVWGNSVKEANNNFMARYFQRNQEAMDAFYARKSQHGGLSLSQKVWKYVGDLRNEMELALSLSMGQGESASSMSRKVRQFLQNPDSMFRRFRVKTGEETIYDADGNPIGTKPIYGRQWKRKVTDPKTGEVHWENYNPKNYHPGAGVYRSSYKNAMRLCRTETNMAYKASEQLRWQQMDFIIGYEVHLSNNHPEYDICNELAGQYPKDFKFTGWHPQCRCYVTPIIMNREERFKLYEAHDNGQEYHSPREIKQMPRKFTEWQKRNAERIKKAEKKGTLPYFLRDNAGIVKGVLDVDNGSNNKKGVGAALGSRKAEKEGWEAYEKFDSTTKLSKDIRNNAVRVKELIGDKKPLVARDFEGADQGLPNKNGGKDNCVNVVLANEMLRRGINVTAKNNYVMELGQDNYASLFLSKQGKPVHINTIVSDNEKVFLATLKKELREGRYILGWNSYDSALLAKNGIIREDEISGHVLTAEVTPSGLQIFDHQDKCFVNIKAIFQNMDLEHGLEYLRIDNKLINHDKQVLEKLIEVLD